MEITYRMQDGFLLPNLMLPAEPEVHLGKYAELRRQYLMKHRRVLYTNLKTTCRLTEPLAEIDPQRWVGLMNNFKHTPEEQVLNDLIYS